MEQQEGGSAPEGASPASANLVQVDRRRLLRGSLGAVPVLATFVSQPVHATYACKSASAYTSANASRPGVTPCNGKSPTWWKTATFPSNCTSGSLFSSYFSVTSTYPAGTTLLQVLQGSSTTSVNKCARNLVAALLNAKSEAIGPGVFTDAQLKTIWLGVNSTGYVPTAGAAAWNAAGVNTWLNTVFPAEI